MTEHQLRSCGPVSFLRTTAPTSPVGRFSPTCARCRGSSRGRSAINYASRNSCACLSRGEPTPACTRAPRWRTWTSPSLRGTGCRATSPRRLKRAVAAAERGAAPRHPGARVDRAPEGFDARFSALERRYAYRVGDSDFPWIRWRVVTYLRWTEPSMSTSSTKRRARSRDCATSPRSAARATARRRCEPSPNSVGSASRRARTRASWWLRCERTPFAIRWCARSSAPPARGLRPQRSGVARQQSRGRSTARTDQGGKAPRAHPRSRSRTRPTPRWRSEQKRQGPVARLVRFPRVLGAESESWDGLHAHSRHSRPIATRYPCLSPQRETSPQIDPMACSPV